MYLYKTDDGLYQVCEVKPPNKHWDFDDIKRFVKASSSEGLALTDQHGLNHLRLTGETYNTSYSTLYTSDTVCVYDTNTAKFMFLSQEDFNDIGVKSVLGIDLVSPVYGTQLDDDATSKWQQQYWYTLARDEPECRCKWLLDGHDEDCDFVKWKLERAQRQTRS
jgi:hypothetical protein